jgi:hypothetical protein
MLTDQEWNELKSWCCENEERILGVSRNIAMVAGGYSRADERFALGQLSADMLAKEFNDMKVAEQQGYDLLFGFGERQIRISVKASQHIFEEMRKRGVGFCKPRIIMMANTRSAESASSRRDDFDVLLVIQTGPLHGGRRKDLNVVRFGMMPNSEWLQGKYVINNDKQQTICIKNDEWTERGFLSADCEVVPVASSDVRDAEKRVRHNRRERLEKLIGLHMLIPESTDDDPEMSGIVGWPFNWICRWDDMSAIYKE